MIQLCRLWLALTVCFTATIGVIRWFGTTQPDPIAILFTNPNGSPCTMPCLFGVRPGDATIGDAIRVLSTHPLTQNMLQLPVMVAGAKYGIELRAEGAKIMVSTQEAYVHNDMQVTNISLAPTSSSPDGLPEPDPRLINAMLNATPGQLVAYFGAPDYVNFANDVTAMSPHDLVVSYPDRGLTTLNWLKTRPGSSFERWITRMDVDNPLHILDLYSLDQREFHIGGYPWSGFTSMKTYSSKLCKVREWQC